MFPTLFVFNLNKNQTVKFAPKIGVLMKKNPYQRNFNLQIILIRLFEQGNQLIIC